MPMTVTIPIIADKDQFPDFLWGSLMHGAFMEMIPYETANMLHNSQLKPWSQYLKKGKAGCAEWMVSSLTEEMDDVLEKHLLSRLPQIKYLRQKACRVKLQPPISIRRKNYIEMWEAVNQEANDNPMSFLSFLTPTAFKQNGRYISQPDISLIYNSLACRWNAFTDCSDSLLPVDPARRKTISQTTRCPVRQIQKLGFSVDRQNIAGFLGIIQFVNDDQEIQRWYRILLDFAGFSGIGIKTALGMGGVTLISEAEVPVF